VFDRRHFMLAAAAVAPLTSATAQAQPAWPGRTVGILRQLPAPSFEAGLGQLGWVEGKNVKFERRVSADDGTLARFAAELSRIPVDVIFAGNAPSTRAAMKATHAIPIVTVSADPVSTGFVASLARPGGNVTGVAMMSTELSGKRLEILIQALPTERRVAFLVNPTNPSSSVVRGEIEARAHALGVQLVSFEVSASERVAKVMAAVAKEHSDALVVQTDPLFVVIHKTLVDLAARHRILRLHGEQSKWEALQEGIRVV
jgi:putative ABC transport system substrate-binding protein